MKQMIPSGRRPSGLKVALRAALAAVAALVCQAAALAQSAPTGPAGGDLSGTYPNPSLASDRVRRGGDAMTGPLEITLSNPGSIVAPFKLSTTGNPGNNRGLALQFHLPWGTSGGVGLSGLGGQITSAWDSAGKTFLGFSAYNGTAVTEVMRVSGSGNVGVGTSNPTSKLHVVSGTTSGVSLLHLDTGVTGGTAMAVGGTAGNESTFDLSVQRGGAYTSRLGVGAAGHLYLQPGPAGNVGVGSTSPTAKLQIGGAFTAPSALDASVFRVNTNIAAVANGDIYAFKFDPTFTKASGGTHAYFVGLNIQAPVITGGAATVTNAASAFIAGAPAGAANNYALWVNGGTTRFDGSVGVGVAAPGANYRLDVAGRVNASAGLCIGGDCKTAWSQVGGASQWAASGANIHYSAGNVGVGTSAPAVKLDVAGSVNASGSLTVAGSITGGTIEAKYQDVAEWVPSTQRLAAGTVVVVDAERTNQVVASTTGYDTKVAGVVSERPGLVLGEGGAGKVMVATTGRVRVRVDATAAPIRVGDLLVTSGVEGVAMKSVPVEVGGVRMHRPGTIIGKALEPLAQGGGEILVLLSLQ